MVNYLRSGSEFSGYFFVGAAVSVQRISRRLPAPAMVLAVLLSLLWAATVLSGVLSVPKLLAMAGNVFLILTLINTASRFPNAQAIRPFAWIGKDSIVPYVTHILILTVLHSLAAKLGLAEGWVGFVTVYVGTVAATLVAIALRPWTNWLYSFPRHPFARWLRPYTSASKPLA